MTTVTVRSQAEKERHLDRVNQAITFDKHKAWDITVEPHQDNKTVQQLRLYWKWIGILMNHHGYDKKEMDFEIRRLHMIRFQFEGLNGTAQEYMPTVRELKVGEMSEYMTAVDRWAAGNGVFLPHPEDMHARK